MVHWNFHHVANVLQMEVYEVEQEKAKNRIKKLRTLVMLACPNLHQLFGNVLACSCIMIASYALASTIVSE